MGTWEILKIDYSRTAGATVTARYYFSYLVKRKSRTKNLKNDANEFYDHKFVFSHIEV